jgi:hypothetical protein
MEVAINLCDSLSERYGLTTVNYHSACVNPVQSFVTKEVKTYYRKRTELMRERNAKKAEMARKAAAESAAVPDTAPRNVHAAKAEANTPQPTKTTATTGGAAQTEEKKPEVSKPLPPKPKDDAENDTARRLREQKEAAVAKAAARSAVESAKQRQAAKAAAKVHPKAAAKTAAATAATAAVPSLEKQMDDIAKTADEISADKAAAENEKRNLREKEMADRIKYVDKRSQARLAALRAKASDREAREKAMLHP